MNTLKLTLYGMLLVTLFISWTSSAGALTPANCTAEVKCSCHEKASCSCEEKCKCSGAEASVCQENAGKSDCSCLKTSVSEKPSDKPAEFGNRKRLAPRVVK